MIQNSKGIFIVFMIIAVMLTVYSIDYQMDKTIYSIEKAAENNNDNGDIQFDSDAHEDEIPNHVSQFICNTENLSTSFAIQNPSFLKFHSYSVWQPPQNC